MMSDTDLSSTRFRPGSLDRIGANLPTLAITGGIVLLVLVFTLANPLFAAPGNVANILRQATYLAIFATAQSLVLMVRGFDLSLGPTVSLVSVCAALGMTGAFGPGGVAVGIVAGLAAAAAVGAVNGYFVAVGRINPFIVTLATMNIVATLAATVTNGRPVAGLPESFGLLAYAAPLGIPVQLWIVVPMLGAIHWIQSRSVFGRAQALIGSNPRAADVAGIPVKRYICLIYIACSVLAGIGAILLSARTASGEPNLGGNLTLEAIAAAVLGGTSVRGGRGTILAPILGALFLAVLANGMDAAAVNGYLQQILLGLVIVGALGLDRLQRD